MAAKALHPLHPSDLPALPDATLALIRACDENGVSTARLARMVAEDPVLTAEVMRLANSAWFGVGRRIRSVAKAVTLLGRRLLRNLVLYAGFKALLGDRRLSHVDLRPFWEAAVRRAVAASRLAAAGRQDPDECFAAALFQDLGLLALFFADDSRPELWPRLTAADPEQRLALERAELGTTHTEVMALLAPRWALPGTLAAAIEAHHDPAACRDNGLAAVLHCADWMGAVLDPEAEPGARLEECCRRAAEFLDLDRDEVEALIAAAPEQVRLAARALNLKVRRLPDLRRLLSAGDRAAPAPRDFEALAGELQQALAERNRLAAELEQELQLAREIQGSLLPAHPGGDFPIFGVNVPARELSGDFYDFFTLDDGRICFNIADVSGKGVTAALLMAKTSSLFRCLGKRIHNPGTLLKILNEEICETAIRGMFVSMVAGVYDPRSRRVRLANAGGPPALLMDARGAAELVPADAVPLGVVPEAEFPLRELDLRDRCLYLVTDGVTEGLAERNGPVEMDRLVALLRDWAGRPPVERLNAVVGALRANENRRRDDLTLLAIEGGMQPEECLLDHRFRARSDALKAMRMRLRSTLGETLCSPNTAEQIVLAVNEACMNIIQHAYGRTREGDIVLRVSRQGDELVVRIVDFAPCVDADCVRGRSLEEVRPGGLGVQLISQVMDHWAFLPTGSKKGNVLEMRKVLGERGDGDAH